jgi:predicted phosphate transport protein (TIGR00153 family)
MSRHANDRRAFTAETDRSIILLFAMVTEALSKATSALLSQDVALAEHVIEEDHAIDQRCEDLTASLKSELVNAAHDAEELETLVDLLQMVPELERSADLAEHIARRTLEGLGGMITPRSRGLIQQMSTSAIRMWHMATEAYEERTREAAYHLRQADHELDELAAGLVTNGAESSEPRVAADVALIARFYERLGDHAVNLAQRIDNMAAPRRLSTPTFFAAYRPSRHRTSAQHGHQPRGLLARLRRIRLAPTDHRFAEVLQAAAANARDCADELSKLMSSFSEIDEHCDRIRMLEHRGDQMAVEVLRLLDTSFITPYDREDIHALIEEIDDVVDYIFAAASLMQIAQVAQPLPELSEQASVLVAITEEMVALLDALQTKHDVRPRLARIGQLEREGDAVFRHCMGRLFSGDFDALDVIMWKDIVQAVEDSLNAVEDVSDVVESILVKSS